MDSAQRNDYQALKYSSCWTISVCPLGTREIRSTVPGTGITVFLEPFVQTRQLRYPTCELLCNTCIVHVTADHCSTHHTNTTTTAHRFGNVIDSDWSFEGICIGCSGPDPTLQFRRFEFTSSELNVAKVERWPQRVL